MAYVTSYGRQCSRCGRTASLVVRNSKNADINFFCERHRKEAEALAISLSKPECA